jgi:hypothetical protein
MSTKFTGSARSWYESLALTDPVFQCVERFIIALKNQFTDPTLKRSAFRELKSIKQVGSTVRYVSEFRKHQAHLLLDDFTARELFLAGLRPSVQKQIAGETFLTFQALIDRAIAIDYVHYDLDGADQSTSFVPPPRTSRSPPWLNPTPSSNFHQSTHVATSPVIDNTQDKKLEWPPWR